MNTLIQNLHAAWNGLTGQHIPIGVCSYEVEFGWHQFIKAGYTQADLELVVAYLQTEIRKGERKPAALRFSNCIGDVLRFSEELELAIGAQRQKPKPTALGRAMQQLRPTVTPVTPHETRVTAVPVSELIANLKRAAGMSVTP